MTTMDESPATASLTAKIEERILAPLRRNPRATRWFAVTVAAILALHGGLLAFFLYRAADAPTAVAKQETPIEIIVEKPKEPPKPPENKPAPPKPEQKQAIEKPANSAPRAPSEHKVETEDAQKETHAPKAPTPPKDGKPEPAKDASAPPEKPAEPAKTEDAAAKPDVLQKDAEALDKAKPKPKDKPKKLAKLTPRAKPRRVPTALQQLAGASSLPDYTFSKPTKRSRVSGGTEDSRYLAIVFGMIMQHRRPVGIPPDADGNVTVAFEVDDDGNVVGIGIKHSSGYREVDAEAAAAIRRSSPFPPPPAGAPHGLVATINYAEAAPVYSMDSRGR